MVPSNFIKFEDISHESVTVVFDLDVCPTLSQGLTGFYLWHRKAGIGDYPSNPTGIILMPLTTFVVTRLAPCTYYVFKVVAFTNSKEFGSWEVRTRTICCPKEQSTKSSMPVDGGTDPNNGSPKANSCGLSNPSSEGVESNNGSTIYADLNKSPECVVEYCENPDILHSDKVSHHCNKSTSHSQNTKMGEVGVSKVDELEEAPGVSASALDEDEEPKSAAQAALLRKPTNLMVYNRGTLKQNLSMIFPGPEIAPHTNTGNKLVAPPEYPCSLLPIILGETENCKGVTGDHIPKSVCLKAETDSGSLSCKRTSGRFEGNGHKNGHQESDTTAQTALLRESSNSMLYSQGIMSQNLNIVDARVENASDAPSGNELAGPLQHSGSLVPITENGIKFGNGISETSFKLKYVDPIPQTGPLKPETEPGSSSNKSPSGKSEDIDHKDARSDVSYEYCVKVIRWLECEGYIEANFRVKFFYMVQLTSNSA